MTEITKCGFTKDHNLVIEIRGEPRKVYTSFGISKDSRFVLTTNFGKFTMNMGQVREHLEAIVQRGWLDIFTCYKGCSGVEEVEEGGYLSILVPPFDYKDRIEDQQFIASLKDILATWDRLFGKCVMGVASTDKPKKKQDSFDRALEISEEDLRYDI
jgi:hypothetical protein